MEMVKRDNNKVAQDGVESTAFQLQGGRLVGEVDEAARPWYERVKGMIWYLLHLLYSALIGLKVVLSNPSNKGNYKRVETNESNKISSSGENKSKEEEASASFDMGVVVSNSPDEEIYEQNETNKSNKFSSSGENKSEDEEASASVGMKSVLSNPPNKEIHDQIETNKSNKFSSSGENISEEERPSKGQEGCENKTNSRGSYDKTKSGEYVLSRSSKKTGEKKRTSLAQ